MRLAPLISLLLPLAVHPVVEGCGGAAPAAGETLEQRVTTRVLDGDLDGDGTPERVTAYLGRSGQRGLLVVDDGGVETTSPIYPIWSAHLADLDGDGRIELVTGAWSRTHRHDEPDPHRTVWVLAYRDGSLSPLWRASALAGPLRDVTTADLDGDGTAELLALEERGGVCVLVAYRWFGAGVVAIASQSLPCVGLSFADGIGQDGALIDTSVGRRTVRLERQELRIDATD